MRFIKSGNNKISMRKSGKQKKGQYLTLENLFFFSIGLALAMVVFFSFSGISDTVRTNSYEKQLLKSGEFIRENIVKVFSAANQTNSSISLTIEIPRELSGCIYKITADTKLNLNCTTNNVGSSLNLYGINTKIKFDALYSSQNYIKINYENGKIIIGINR